MCTFENCLQKLSEEPNNYKCPKTKNRTISISRHISKKLTEYIQNPIDKIRDSVEDRQSRIAWQTINEVSRRKSTAKAKLKAANQQEGIKLWKQHFVNLLGNPPKLTQEPITRIISKQLDIKLGPFTKKNSARFLEKLKIGKPQGLTRFPQKYGRPDSLPIYCSDTATQSIIKIRYTDG